jgi:hypothetical protein
MESSERLHKTDCAIKRFKEFYPMDMNQSLTGSLQSHLKTIIPTIPAYKGWEL